MKRFLLLLIVAIGFTLNGNAQPPTYDDLVIYFADGNYDKLLKQAEKYTLSDKTKGDAIPYLYLAKCNFEMSKDQKWLDKYPKAFSDAIKFAGNCVKRDERAGTTVVKDNIAFFTDIKVVLVEEIKNMIAEESYARLQGHVAKLHRFNKDDIGSYFVRSGSQYMNKDNSSGRISEQEAFDKLNAVTSVEDWRPVDYEMLKVGVMLYCDAQINMLRQDKKAKDLLGKVKQWLENDEEFMDYYNCVMFAKC